jgi:hypothetical protein
LYNCDKDSNGSAEDHNKQLHEYSASLEKHISKILESGCPCLNDPHLNVPEICFQKYVAWDALGEMEGLFGDHCTGMCGTKRTQYSDLQLG